MKPKTCWFCGSIELYDDSYGTEICPKCKEPAEKKEGDD